MFDLLLDYWYVIKIDLNPNDIELIVSCLEEWEIHCKVKMYWALAIQTIIDMFELYVQYLSQTNK
jgi:hypothetical protein